jgi:hypothetical protein
MKNLEFKDELVVEYFREHYRNQAGRAMAELAVLQLVSQKEISPMTGAELLGLHLTEFVELLATHKIPYFTESPRDPTELTSQYRAHRQKHSA